MNKASRFLADKWQKPKECQAILWGGEKCGKWFVGLMCVNHWGQVKVNEKTS